MVNNKDLEFLIHEFASMGFDPQDIIMAWFNSNQRKAQVLDHLLAIAKEKGKGKVNDVSQNNNELNQSQAILEEQIQKAIQMSIEEGEKYIKPSQLLRSNGKPVGLKNVGNTCYFNSLIQTIIQVPEFLSIILSYRPPTDIDQALANLKITDATAIKRKKGCVKLVLALRKLFVLMLFGNKNLVDPSEVTRSLIDANGSPMKIGEQLDIGEFSINLFERLEEGLQLDIGPETEDEVIIKKPVNFKELFFGTSKDFITFEWADFKSKKDQDAVFGPISLSIEEKDLMSSLDAYANFSVDGYQTPNGDITTAKKRIWITKAPKVMTFMLQRSVYDKEKGLMKANNPFTFPKEILIDRFLYENKRNLKEMLQENKVLKAKLLKIDDEIAKMHEYGKTKSDLLKTLETCAEFIDEQADNMADDFIEVHSDTSIDKIEDCGDVSELRKVSEILKKYQENCILRIEALKKKKQFIKDRIEKSFQNLQKFKYRLHSVVIHEGGINSGHYYTLIHNPKKNKWVRFNDSVVQEISEEEAFKLATGGNEVEQNSLKSSPKNPCAYSLFYVEDNCEVLDFSPECLESLKKLLSKELLSFAETENAKFLTEYQHYNAGLIQKINDEYFLKMNTLIFEASKFQKELKGKKFPFIPSIPNFTSFLLLETPKCTEIARWNALKTVLDNYKVPYNVLEGEKKNYYYHELKELLVLKTSIYNLKSLELAESEKELLAQKKKEYLILAQCLAILENIFELINAKKWKETMATVSFLHEKIGQIKMNEYTNQFFSFSSYLLSLISLRFCALIDRHQAKGETKEALKLLELMIFCLNRKESIKPPEIFYQQIIANLYYTINCTGRKNIKEADLFIFIHHIQKIEEKCEFLPSQDILSLLKPELRNQLIAIQNDQTLIANVDSKNVNKLNDLFNTIVKDRIRVWVDFEAFIRKGNILMDQDTRVHRENSVSD